MPPESLTLALTSGFGVGIIAGIVSGVCYVIFHGFSDKRAQNASDDSVCNVCGKTFYSTEVILGTKEVVTCEKCQRKVCKSRCSSQNLQKLWICAACQNSESWFKGILKTIGTKSDKPAPILAKQAKSGGMNQVPFSPRDEKELVRDFIERLVESILGNNVDDVSVTRIYNEEKYDHIMFKYHLELSNTITELGSALHMTFANLPIIGQSPCAAHSNFKQLIQKIVQESIGLPKLKKVQDIPSSSDDKTYENLLATAIINKVVQSYQEELATIKKPTKPEDNKEYFFSGETLDTKWKNTDVDSTSASSLEEWMRSDDSSGVSSKYVDSTSLTVDDNEDKVKSPGRIFETNNSENWKNNWLMQENKLKLSRTSSPVPVPMLVPNPTVEAKVLIGDREAEDTTDLSDAGSDVEDTESVSSFENIKNKMEMLSSDGLNKDAAITKTQEEEMLSSIESGMEQDSEYTEKYATLPKTILKNPSPAESSSTEEELPKSEKQQENVEEKRNFVSEQFKGGYSEREKQKWNNAIEMKNNPYSPENLKQRLSNPIIRFGRDYYVKAAANAAGTRKKIKNDYQADAMTDPVYKAIPVYVNSSSIEENSSIETSSSFKSIMELSSDSDKSIERIYNLNSGKVYEKLAENSQEVIVGSKNPPGLKTEVKSNKLDLVFDENHNSTESLTKNLEMDPEIKLLNDQQLVKSRLGIFSKSYPTLDESFMYKESPKVTNTSICDLKLKFNCKQDVRNDKLEQIYSLTARSIPSQVRKELQETQSDQIDSSLVAPKPEEIVPDEEFPAARSMIQFYENLKR